MTEVAMNRRDFLKLVGAGSAAMAVQPFGCTPKLTKQRPNFVIILCDDLGYGDLASYGNETIKSPNIDRLASESIRLTDCYTAAPVCSPARAGLLTGRTPSRVGVYDWIPKDHRMHMPQNELSVAKLLSQADYATCHVGKWHCNGKFNSPEQPQPNDHGFDYWFSTQNNASPTHHNPVNFVRNGKEAGQLEGYSCQIIVDEAIDWLKNRETKDKPFFLFVCFHEPHEPIDSPQQFLAMYPEARKEGEALYYANVTNMDAAVGKLVDALDEMKLKENTLVFFTSDNGPETLNRYGAAWRSHGSPGPLRGMKLHLYEGGIRVPGMLWWPGRIKSGTVSHEPISGVDVLPTLCEISGISVPGDRPIDGTSFLPVIEGGTLDRRVPLFWHYYRALGGPRVALRNGDWKVLGFWDGPDRPGDGVLADSHMKLIKGTKLIRFELYNLAEDVSETKDLASEQPERLKRMSDMLNQMYDEVLAEGPNWPEAGGV